jgi:hypothetical protein
MAGLSGTPSEKAFFVKILKLYWTAWRVQACYSNAARTAQREHTAMKLLHSKTNILDAG